MAEIIDVVEKVRNYFDRVALSKKDCLVVSSLLTVQYQDELTEEMYKTEEEEEDEAIIEEDKDFEELPPTTPQPLPKKPLVKRPVLPVKTGVKNVQQ